MNDPSTAATTKSIGTDPPAGPGTAGSARGEMIDPAETVRSYERSPEDLLRLVVSMLLATVVVVAIKLLADAVGGFGGGLVDLLAVRSEDLLRILEGLLQLTYAAALVITLLVPLLTRRYRVFGYVLTVDILCALLMAGADTWIDLSGATNAAAAAAGVDDGPLPDATTVAQVAASFVVFSPFVTRRWRRLLLSLFCLLVVLQVLVSVHSPAATAVALVFGPLVGSATLLLYGRPRARPNVAAIGISLRASGLEVSSIEPASVDARGSTPYFVTLADGSRLFTKVLGANERAADLLFRLYRQMRLKNVGDERPDSSLRRTVEHEALVSLKARDVGVATPRLRSLARVGQDSFLLAYDLIPGSSMDSVPVESLTDDVLREVWDQVALLRSNRIAHRDLRLANLFLDADGRALLIDFGFAEVAAGEELLRSDVAQLLASLALVVGVERTVESAIAGIGSDAVASCTGRLQAVALSGATQSALKERPGLLDELRDEVARRCGVESPVLDPLVRFRPSNGVLLVLVAVLLYVGLPMLVGAGAVGDVLTGADWSVLGALFVAAIVVELGVAWGFSASAPLALPALPVILSSPASKFASATSPATLGGSSLRNRLLERHGADRHEASASTALAGAVTVITRVVLLVAFLVWAGRTAFDSAELTRPGVITIGTLAVLGAAVVSLAVPAVRRSVTEGLRSNLAGARSGLHRLSGSPARVAATFAAATVVALSHIGALQAAGEAFGFDRDVATTGSLWLAGVLISALVATPGHLVALEIMLVAGLVADGVPGPVAAATVLLYRAVTFWIPIGGGWPAYDWLRRNQQI